MHYAINHMHYAIYHMHYARMLNPETRPRAYIFSCSARLSMTFFLLINVKMPTVVGILTFMSRKNSILCLSEPEKAEFLDIFILMSI